MASVYNSTTGRPVARSAKKKRNLNYWLIAALAFNILVWVIIYHFRQEIGQFLLREANSLTSYMEQVFANFVPYPHL
ncbi:MAG: hypothetical protein AAB883_02835 [Patescibacteria group bacterium]